MQRLGVLMDKKNLGFHSLWIYGQQNATFFFSHFELQAQDWQALLRDSGHFKLDALALNTSQHISTHVGHGPRHTRWTPLDSHVCL